MKAIVTICSREKATSADDLPAYLRYTSQRIQNVREIADKEKLPFYIFSGKYGLVESKEITPYYDHLLSDKEIPDMIQFVKTQVQLLDINEIDFYAKARRGDWIPYYEVMETLADQGVYTMNVIPLE